MSSFDEIKNLVETLSDFQKAKLNDLSNRLDGIEAAKNHAEVFGSAPVAKKANPEHSKAFMAFARKGIESGLRDIEINAAMTTADDPSGGYAVPTTIDGTIEKLLVDQSPMRRICTVIPISTPDYHKLVNKGGTSSGWVGETEERPETSTPQLAKLVPYLGEIYANPAATQQSLDDMGFDVESFLGESIGEEFAMRESEAFITGSGLKTPKGLLTYPTATTADATRDFGTLQYKKTGDAGGFIAATATASPADCLVDLLYSVRKAYRRGSVWLMNSNTLSVVSKMKDAINGLPVWSRGLAEGQPSTLLGYAIEEDENMPDIGAGAFPIAFGSFKRAFVIVDRQQARILRDPFTNKPFVHFYSSRRVGNFLQNSQAVKLLKISA